MSLNPFEIKPTFERSTFLSNSMTRAEQHQQKKNQFLFPVTFNRTLDQLKTPFSKMKNNYVNKNAK